MCPPDFGKYVGVSVPSTCAAPPGPSNTKMPSDSWLAAVPFGIEQKTWRVVTARPWPRLPCVTSVVYAWTGKPKPLWLTDPEMPLCSRMDPLTLHSLPGIVTSPQFTCAAAGMRGAAVRSESANPLVPAMVASTADTTTNILTYFTRRSLGPVVTIIVRGGRPGRKTPVSAAGDATGPAAIAWPERYSPHETGRARAPSHAHD